MQRVLSFPTSRGVEDPGEFVTKRLCFSFMFSVGFLALLAGFLLGRFAFDQELELSRIKLRKAHQEQNSTGAVPGGPRANWSDLTEGVASDSVLRSLMVLSNRSGSSAGSESPSLRQAQILQAHLRANGFDLVSQLVQSQIHLSYPDPSQPNKVVVVDGRGSTVLQSDDARPAFTGPIASPSANTTSIIEGPVVYVNFGRNEDYHYLDSLNTGVSVSGRVVLARAGAIPPTDMVNIALDHEARGVVMFVDPQQQGAAPRDQPLLSAVELASLQALHVRHSEFSGNESVPVLVITAADAEKILKEMSSDDPSPESWRGDLESSYPIGVGFSDPDWQLLMYVNTLSFVKTYHNVLAAMRGSHEPDRYVILAAERDPWLLDDRDQRGTAALMEVARVLGDLRRTKDWRPHRSIVLASWGLHTPEQHLSQHPEAWWSHLELKTTAYLKIDSSDFGNQSVSAVGSPLMESVFREAADRVHLPPIPMDFILQLGTDQLLTQHGVPFLQLRPIAQSGNSSSGAGDRLQAVTALWTSLVWRLADSPSLPFTVDSYISLLSHSAKVLSDRFQTVAKRHSLFLDSVYNSVDRLVARLRTFRDRVEAAQQAAQQGAQCSETARVVNDQLLQLAHAISCPGTQQDHKRLPARHMVLSRSTSGSEPTAGFGVLQDLLRELTSTDAPDDLQRQILTHVASLVQCLDAAAYSVTDGLDALVMGDTPAPRGGTSRN